MEQTGGRTLWDGESGRPRDLISHARELRLTIEEYYQELRDATPAERASRSELLKELRATACLADAVDALQTLVIAAFAATGCSTTADEATGAREEIGYPLGHKAEFADAHVCATMGWTPAQGSARVDNAIDAATLTARLLDEQAAGRAGTRQVAIVAETLRYAPQHIASQVVDEVIERGIAAWTTTQTRRRTGALLRDADPIAAETQRAEHRRRSMDVTIDPSPVPGLSDVKATLPAEDAARLFAAINQRAEELKKDASDPVTIGQCRVQSLIDLILANATISTKIELRVPVKPVRTPQERRAATAQQVGITPDMPAHDAADLAAHLLNTITDDEDPSPLDWPEPTREDWLVHEGLLSPPSLDPMIPAPPPDLLGMADIDWDACLANLLDELADRLPATPAADLRPTAGRPAGSSGLCDVLIPGVGVVPAHAVQELIATVGTTFTRTLLDNSDGTTVHTSTTTYRPTAGIRDFVIKRDRHCRFPGCTARPQLCDLDHLQPWPGGPTSPLNLHLLCRHHHRAKHQAGWTVEMTTDGVETWTSPTGEQYITTPGESATG